MVTSTYHPTEKLDHTPIRIWDKCLREYNELQEMVKKKEKLQHINVRHQKFQNKIQKGFKITSRHSQVFEHSPVENFNNDETDENKDHHSSKEGSLNKSDLTGNSKIMSPDKRDEYHNDIHVLDELPSCFQNKEGKPKKKLKKVGFSDKMLDVKEIHNDYDENMNDTQSKVEITKNLEIFNSIMDDNYFNNEKHDENFHSKIKKTHSDTYNGAKKRKSLRREIIEQAENTHQDDYFRQEELKSWSEKKKALYMKLDGLIDTHVRQIIDHYFKEKELKEIFQNDHRQDAEHIWKERFFDYTIKAIRLVKPSQRVMDDSMDINNYVEIELIEYDDDTK